MICRGWQMLPGQNHGMGGRPCYVSQRGAPGTPGTKHQFGGDEWAAPEAVVPSRVRPLPVLAAGVKETSPSAARGARLVRSFQRSGPTTCRSFSTSGIPFRKLHFGAERQITASQVHTNSAIAVQH